MSVYLRNACEIGRKVHCHCLVDFGLFLLQSDFICYVGAVEAAQKRPRWLPFPCHDKHNCTWEYVVPVSLNQILNITKCDFQGMRDVWFPCRWTSQSPRHLIVFVEEGLWDLRDAESTLHILGRCRLHHLLASMQRKVYFFISSVSQISYLHPWFHWEKNLCSCMVYIRVLCSLPINLHPPTCRCSITLILRTTHT